MKSKPFKNLIKYDFIVFFREPFYALGGMVMPCIFFAFLTLTGRMPATRSLPFYSLFIAFVVIFFNIGLQYTIDKENGVHKRLVLSSITKKHLVYASIIRGVLCSLVAFVSILLISILGSGVDVPHHFVFFFLGYLGFIALLLLMCLCIYDLFTSMKMALPFSIFMMQYVFIFSGAIFPVQAGPEFLKFIVYPNPFYHMHQILLQLWDWKLDDVSLVSVGYLVAIALVCIGLIGRNNLRREA
jgi:ABC-type polysaccharide/polyol phosphate export permease